MQSRTSATRMAREMGVQHILPPTLTTTTMASLTLPVSVTSYSHIHSVSFHLNARASSGILVPGPFSRLTLSADFRSRGLLLVLQSPFASQHVFDRTYVLL